MLSNNTTSTISSSSSSSSTTSYPFEILPNLPRYFEGAQCIIFEKEILICGGYSTRDCYSYHIIKKSFKLFGNYPNDIIRLCGHSVIKIDYHSSKNKITLLSFGGQRSNEKKYTLILKYQSVWTNNNNYNNNKNLWSICKHNIGHWGDDMTYIRALTGGFNNNLLFIIYTNGRIDVLDLQSFKCIVKSNLPIYNYLSYNSCFCKSSFDSTITNTINTNTINTTSITDIITSSSSSSSSSYNNNNNNNNVMFVFTPTQSVIIKYEEITKSFEFEILSNDHDILMFHYSYICLDRDFLILFGNVENELFYSSYNNNNNDNDGDDFLTRVFLYSIPTKTWRVCPTILPTKSSFSAIFNSTNTWVHIISHLEQHWRIRTRDLIGWKLEELESILNYWAEKCGYRQFGWIPEFNDIVINYILEKKSINLT